MKFTLLEGVQDVLSAMDSDEVTGISDTTESLQVATIFKQVYFDIINDLDLPELKETFSPTAGDDGDRVLMTLPDNIVKVHWLKYNIDDTINDYRTLCFLRLDEFINRSNAIKDHPSVAPVNPDDEDPNLWLNYLTNKQPEYYTLLGTTLIFDSIDTEYNPIKLEADFMIGYGSVNPTFTMDDAFIPDLDAQQFRYWLHRVKTRAFFELKQMQNPEAAGEARRQKIMTQKRKNRILQTNRPITPNYGRK